MKEKFNIFNANIENLTSLWKMASGAHESYYKSSAFDYCEIKDSDWPNKLWFNQDINQEIITSAKEKISSNLPNLVIPYWDIHESQSYKLLEKNGFKILTEQTGMSLKLNRPIQVQNDLNIQLVASDSEAKLWTDLFTASFGYRISLETLLKTCKNINYFTAYNNDQAVGTAILHKTNDILGIHAFGIVPDMRKKGFAEQTMKLFINMASESELEYMTLQSSNMGKNLYLKLGFEEQFVIKNYSI